MFSFFHVGLLLGGSMLNIDDDSQTAEASRSVCGKGLKVLLRRLLWQVWLVVQGQFFRFDPIRLESCRQVSSRLQDSDYLVLKLSRSEIVLFP